MWRRSDLLHPATIISSIALFVALGGVTYAAATIGPNQLKTGAVTRSKIKNSAVSPSKLANRAVTNSKLANDAITPSKLRTNAVTLGKIADAAVATTNLANSSVTESKLGSGSVRASKLAAGAVGASALADGAVTPSKLSAPVVQGAGTRSVVVKTVAAGATGDLATISGFGKFSAACAAGQTTLTFTSSIATEIDSTLVSNPDGAGTAVSPSEVPAQGTTSSPSTGAAGVRRDSWQLSYADASGAPHVLTATFSVAASTGGACEVTGDALA